MSLGLFIANVGEGRERVVAQLLGDRLHLPRGDALDVQLGQRCHQRLLGALVAPEQLGREPNVLVLRHAQLQLAYARDEGARVMDPAVAEPSGRPLALLGPERRSSRLPASPASPRGLSRAARQRSYRTDR